MPSDPALHNGTLIDDFLSANSPNMAPMDPDSNPLSIQERSHFNDFLNVSMTPMNRDTNSPQVQSHVNHHSSHSFSTSPVPHMTSLIPPDHTDRSHLNDFVLSSHSSLSTSPAANLTPDTNPVTLHDHAHLNEIVRSKHSLSSSPATSLTPLTPDGSEYLRPVSRGDMVRKISDTSVHSEPIFDLEGSLTSSHGYPAPQSQLHLSLPDLVADESAYPSISVDDTDSGGGISFNVDGPSSSGAAMPRPSPNLSSPTLLQGAQMKLIEMIEDIPEGFLGSYRTNSSIPSSPSAASVTSSNMSMQDMFDESPSVKELCEMLSDSVNMQQSDMALTGTCACVHSFARVCSVVRGGGGGSPMVTVLWCCPKNLLMCKMNSCLHEIRYMKLV